MIYKYPDKNDKIVVKSIEKRNMHGYNWEKSENYALSNYYKLVGKQGRMLDIGGGKGRLTIKFAEKFNHIDFVEPDEERMAEAKKNIWNEGIESVSFYQKKFLEVELKEGSYDMILISHVLQHIKTEKVGLTIRKAYKLLRKGGIIIILTTHSGGKGDIYRKYYLSKEEEKETITEEEFNSLINNKKGILPVRIFSLRTLMPHLWGFKVEYLKVFHLSQGKNLISRILTSKSRFLIRERIANLPIIKRSVRGDVGIIAKKR